MKFLSLVILMIASVSCSKQQEVMREDTSHSTGQAVKNGLPSIERDWSYIDLNQFHIYLNSLQDAVVYPTYHSNSSGVIFKKLISSIDLEDNLLIKNKKLDLMARLKASTTSYQITISIMTAYSNKHVSGIYDYSTEIAYLLGASLCFVDTNTVLIKKMESFLDPSNPRNDMLVSGIKDLRGSVHGGFNALLYGISKDAESDNQLYDESEHKILAKYLLKYGKGIVNWSKPSIREEYRLRIKKLSESHQSEAMRAAASKLLKAQQVDEPNP